MSQTTHPTGRGWLDIAGRPNGPDQVAGTGSREWALAAVLLLVGSFIRIWAANNMSLTSDEITDLNVARSPTDVSGFLDGGKRFPFLFHALLRAWLGVFTNPDSARYLSIVIGLAAMVAIWRLARRMVGKTGGLVALGFATVSPFMVWYSTEIRAYGLVILFVALTMLAYVRLVAQPSLSRWLGLFLSALGGLFTHYYFVFFLAIVGVFLLRSGILAANRRVSVAVTALAMVAMVPWVLSLRLDLRGDWGASRLSEFGIQGLGYTYFSQFSGYTLGPSLRELHDLSLTQALPGLVVWIVLILPAVGVIAASGYKELRPRGWFGLLASLIFIPVVAVGILSDIGVFGYNVRHVAYVIVPLTVWIGAGGQGWRGSRFVIPAAVVLLIVSGVALWNRVHLDEYRNENSRAVALSLERAASSGDVFVSVGYMSRPIDEYLSDSFTVTALPDVGRDGAGLDQLLEIIDTSSNDDGYWVAYTREFHGDPGGILAQTLQERGAIVHSRHAGIVLYEVGR